MGPFHSLRDKTNLPSRHADPELQPGDNGGSVPEREGGPGLHCLLQQLVSEHKMML